MPGEMLPKEANQRNLLFLVQDYFAQSAFTRADNSGPQSDDVTWVQVILRLSAEYRRLTRFCHCGESWD